MIEADSNGNEDALPRQYTRISNATFIDRGSTQGGNAVLIRGGADYAILNSILVGPQACLDIDATGGTTTRAADNGLQDVGPPVFRSFQLDCPTAFRDDGNVSTADIAAIFGTGTNNNNSAFDNSLTNVFVNGPNESAVAATDPTPFNDDPFGPANAAAPNRLSGVAYIGAVRDNADTWFSGWACTSFFANFGAGGLCTSIPTT